MATNKSDLTDGELDALRTIVTPLLGKNGALRGQARDGSRWEDVAAKFNQWFGTAYAWHNLRDAAVRAEMVKRAFEKPNVRKAAEAAESTEMPNDGDAASWYCSVEEVPDEIKQLRFIDSDQVMHIEIAVLIYNACIARDILVSQKHVHDWDYDRRVRAIRALMTQPREWFEAESSWRDAATIGRLRSFLRFAENCTEKLLATMIEGRIEDENES